MKNFVFDIQRFVIPTLLSGEDGGGVRYWNTIPGAAVSGFGNTFFVNHGAGCVIYCEGDNTKVYNDTVAPNVVINGAGGHDWLINDAVNVEIYGGGGQDDTTSASAVATATTILATILQVLRFTAAPARTRFTMPETALIFTIPATRTMFFIMREIS